MTTPEKIRAERYASFSIPPIMLNFDVQVSKDTQLKMQIVGQFGPNTADRLKALCDHILSVVRELEHEPIDAPSMPAESAAPAEPSTDA